MCSAYDTPSNHPSYANEYDMVPRWGVLYSTREILSNRYAGAVFVRIGASGHMFNQHYMDAMFPLTEHGQQSAYGDTSTANIFLDQVVDVDSSTVSKRETTLMRLAGGPGMSGALEFGDGEQIADGESRNSIEQRDALLTFERTDSGRMISEVAVGKTVRELSRLWRYQGGRSPTSAVGSSYGSGE